MAHRKPQTPVIPSNSLVASAVRYTGKVARIYQGSQNWQTECYRHYAICGEARFAARFYGHALSRAVLGVGKKTNGRMEWSEGGPAKALLDELFNGKDGQTEMLESIGVHLAIAGECYLIGRTVKGSAYQQEGEVWEIVSIKEIKVQGQKWSLSFGGESPDVVLADDDVAIRMWVPDPANRMQADSPFRSLLPILSEIEWATKSIFGQITSRLAGAGLLMLPQGMTFPDPPAIDGKPQQYKNEAEGFMLALADAMMKPIEDPSSPASKVPLIVTAPPDAIDKARLLHFWSELDATYLELRNEAIRRFALGMDVPPEQILGMSSNPGTGGGTSNGVSHWGAWQIEEATIKMHIEPMLDVVVNTLTVGYLRPLLPDTDEIVGYDTKALRLRPDRSKEAIELGDRGLLKNAVILRENGFDPEADAPDDDEYKIWLLRKIATGSATPDQVAAALKELGVDIGLPYQQEPQALPSGGGDEEISDDDDCDDEYWDCYTRNGRRYRRRKRQSREARPAPSMEDHPTKPRTPAESSVLIAACDSLVWRALEKAGNRVLNAGTRGKDRDRTVDPTEFHLQTDLNGQGQKLLEGAFAYAPQVLDGIADPEKVVATLENYCLALFQAKMPHAKEHLAEYLRVHGLSEHGWVPSDPKQPITLHVNVEAAQTPVTVNMPDGFVHLAPEVHVPVPSVTVENQVNPTPVTVEAPNVTVENTVEAGAAPEVTVEVAAPEVTVEAPKVTVSPKVTADVKIPKRKTVREVIRDGNGDIAGSVEIEEEA